MITLVPFLGQPIGVAFSIAGEQSVGFDLAQAVAELVEAVAVVSWRMRYRTKTV